MTVRGGTDILPVILDGTIRTLLASSRPGLEIERNSDSALEIRRAHRIILLTAIGLTVVHLVLSLSYPRVDWDILQASLDKSPHSNAPVAPGLGRPVLGQALLPGVLVWLFANLSGLPFLTAHVIVSAHLLGLTLYLLMFLSFRITRRLHPALLDRFGLLHRFGDCRLRRGCGDPWPVPANQLQFHGT